jgi:POT family proton-dependent oligopeptide transporter
MTEAERFSHPRGIYTLFFTEMWERMSYYGMRALLVLFMVEQVARGGMGLSDEMATAIYGLYTAGVYLSALPGGWIGDRILGAQRAVWIGGVLIACGHFSLALPVTQTFFLGLLLIVVGSGLLKPNISSLVAALYPQGGQQRDAGFTLFYMGVNLGATIGPLLCSYLGEKLNWHYGFTAAGLGMVTGLVHFRFTRRHLGDAGLRPVREARQARRDRILVAISIAAVIGVVIAIATGVIPFNPMGVAK